MFLTVCCYTKYHPSNIIIILFSLFWWFSAFCFYKLCIGVSVYSKRGGSRPFFRWASAPICCLTPPKTIWTTGPVLLPLHLSFSCVLRLMARWHKRDLNVGLACCHKLSLCSCTPEARNRAHKEAISETACKYRIVRMAVLTTINFKNRWLCLKWM